MTMVKAEEADVAEESKLADLPEGTLSIMTYYLF
jgi:hypothetical protein